MGKSHSPTSLSPETLRDMLSGQPKPVLADVRKDDAFRQSGRLIPGAIRIAPQDVAGRAGDFTAETVIVYCVHGHEVSQGACDALRKAGVDARFLEGGFEAWRAAGFATTDRNTCGRS